MAGENSLASRSLADEPNLKAGQLLHFLHGQLKASNVIDGGTTGGLIRSRDDSPEGIHPDGLTQYQPGQHHPELDLDICATLANRMPLADTRRNLEEPRKLHIVADYGQRYEGATGVYPLRGLARLAVAMVCIYADKKNLQLRTIATSDDRPPLMIDRVPTNAVWALSKYDEYTSSAVDGQPNKNNESTLTNGLELLRASQQPLQPNADAVVVISDFVSGAHYDQDGQLTGFDWQLPLERLQQRLGDRLFTVRLTTPAQSDLPYASAFAIDGEHMELDFGDYLQASEQYNQAAEEHEVCINGILSRQRHLNLSSQNARPFIELTDFVFGKPRA